MIRVQSRATWPGRPRRQLWIPRPCISSGLWSQVPAPAWPQARPGSPACLQWPSPARPGPFGRPQCPAPRAPLLACRPEPPRPCARLARSPQRPAGLPAQPCPESSYSGLALSSCRIRVSRQGAWGQRAQQGRAGLPACSQHPTFLSPSLLPSLRGDMASSLSWLARWGAGPWARACPCPYPPLPTAPCLSHLSLCWLWGHSLTSTCTLGVLGLTAPCSARNGPPRICYPFGG